MIHLEKELAEWHRFKYGDRLPIVSATVRKFHEEVGELCEALMTGNTDAICEEAADVLFVLCHIVRGATGGEGALEDAARKKLDEIWLRLKKERAQDS